MHDGLVQFKFPLVLIEEVLFYVVSILSFSQKMVKFEEAVI